MPKYARPDKNIRPFAADSSGLNRTVFGQTEQSDELADNLTPEYYKGWELTGVNDAPTKQDFNAQGYTLGALLAYLYQAGIAEWAPAQEYYTNSFAQYGGKLYISTAGTGGSPNVGNQPDSAGDQWKRFDELVLAESILDSRENAVPNAETVRAAINNAAGANSIPTYYPGQFMDFMEQTPPSGWAVRDGSVLTMADVNYPELWAELQKPANAWKCKTLAQWQALSSTAGGVGGVPYFVLDTTAKTIKLPDTRTDFFRDGGNVGVWQDWAMKNITGQQYIHHRQLHADPNGSNGVFYTTGTGTYGEPAGQSLGPDGAYYLHFDASRSVGAEHVAEENRPRNIALLGCVCIEPAKAQRNEATTTTPGGVYLATGLDDPRPNAVPSANMINCITQLPANTDFNVIKTAGNYVLDSDNNSPVAGAFWRLYVDVQPSGAVYQYAIPVANAGGVFTTYQRRTILPSQTWDAWRNFAALGMPSSRYIDYPLPDNLVNTNTWGGNITAPADGWFFIVKESGGTSTSSKYAFFENAGNRLTQHAWCTVPTGRCATYLPVKKGDLIRVQYSATGQTDFFRFIYAEGAY